MSANAQTNPILGNYTAGGEVYSFGTNFDRILAVIYDGNPPCDPVNPAKDSTPSPERGDPFNAINGAAYRDETDIFLPAPGLPLAFGRNFNSLSSGGAEFGTGWRASTDWELLSPVTSNSILRVRAGDGRIFSFGRTGEVWRCKRDVRARVCPVDGGGWTLDGLDDGAAMRFDDSGRWLWTDDGWSNRVTAARDSEGRLTNMSHSCGHSLAISWNSNRVESVSTPGDLLRSEYAYSASGMLTAVVRRAASGLAVTRLYAYDSSRRLTNTVNALGQSVNHGYDLQPDGSIRCTGSTFGDGTLSANASWDTTGRSLQIAYPVSAGSNRYENIVWHANIPRLASIEQGGETLSVSYDPTTLEPTGQVWTAGNQTAARYDLLDSQDRPTNTTFALGSGPAPNWRTEWHATLDLPVAEIDPLGWRTEYTWTNGLVTGVQTTHGLGGWIESSLVWSQRLLTAATDPLGRTTSLSYDNYGGITNFTPPVGPSLACTNDALGNPVWFRLPDADNGDRVWQVERDGLGRATRVTDPEGGEIRLEYDLLGHTTASVDRAGRQTFYTYGTAGRPLSVDRVISENGTNRTVTLAMDYDLQMEPAAIRDALGRTVESWTPDAAGRVARITNIEGRVASVTYGVLSLPLAVDRFDGTSVTFAYNSAGRLAELAFPDRTNQFAWLDNGLPAAASDGLTTVTNEWIAPGRLTAQETRTPDWTGRVEYRYDLAGAVTQTMASAIGFEQTIACDAGGRETNRMAACGGTTITATREYADWNGLPSRVTAGPLEQQFGWDRLDRLTNLAWQVSGATVRQIAYQHDLLGRITQRVDRVAGGETVRSYTYDDLDRLVFEEHSTGYTAAYAFDDVGRRTTKTVPRFDVTYTSGAGDRLACWDVTGTNQWNLGIMGSITESPATNPVYRFQEVRNAQSAVAPVMTGTSFTATLPASPLGTQTVIAAISDAAGNVGVATNIFVSTAYTRGEYAGDAAGCVTQIVYRGPACRQERTLIWDSQYRLISVATNGIPAESYGYDPYGRRIWTATAGITNWHIQDGAHVLADLDATGGVIRTYTYGPNIDELIAMTVYTGAVSQTYYAIHDHQNTVWAWADETGAVVESYDYDAGGRVLSVRDANGFLLTSDLGLSTSAIGNRFLFQGREYSWQTGLYHFRARWYDPVTGRWLSNDPIGITGGWNQYAFCANNPVNFVDPFGFCSEDYWDRYWKHVDAYSVNVGPYALALVGGLLPKSWSIATDGRPPAMGSKNPLTSVPRSLGIPAARTIAVRGGAALIGMATVGVGYWNIGVFVSGLGYAAVPGLNGL